MNKTSGIILLLLMFSAWNGYASDSTRIDNLGAASLKIVYNNPDSARKLVFEALELCDKEKSDELYALTYNYLGIYYDVASEFDSALSAYRNSIVYAEKAEDNFKQAQAHNNIGLLYWNSGQLQNSIEEYYKGLEAFEQLKSEKGQSSVHSNLGLLFNEEQQFDKAIYHCKEALRIKRKLGDTIGIGKALANLGITYSTMGIPDSNRLLQKQALRYFIDGNNDFHIGACYQDIAVDFNITEQYDSSYKYALRALDYRLSVGNKKYIAANYNLLGRTEVLRGNLDEAEKYYFKSLEIYEKYNIVSEMHRVYERLAVLYQDKTQFEKSNIYWNKRVAITDSIYSADKIEKLLEVEAKYENEKAQRELLERDKELLVREKERSYLWFGLLILFLTAVGSVMFFRNRIRKNKALKKRELLEQKLEISRELHDNIGSQLTYINMGLESASDLQTEQREVKIQQVKNFTKKTIGDLRTTVWGLNKEVNLDDLSSKVASEVAKVKMTTEASVTFKTNLTPIPVSSTVAINVFRVVQEALQNAVKHARAGEINVELHYEDISQQLSAVISDDGVGLENKNHSGFGLLSMQQRADKIEAELTVKSEDGCIVKITKNMSNDL